MYYLFRYYAKLGNFIWHCYYWKLPPRATAKYIVWKTWAKKKVDEHTQEFFVGVKFVYILHNIKAEGDV